MLGGPDGSSKMAEQSQAEMISQISTDERLRVAQTEGSGKKGNQLDGNPSKAPTTHHAYGWSACLKWLDAKTCEKWLDPFVAGHGFDKDSSALEKLTAQFWTMFSGEKSGNVWTLWNVETRNGMPVADDQGRLNQENLVKYDLRREVKEEIEKLAKDSAQDLLIRTVGKEESKETMPNMEGLRAIAANLTVSYRNNLLGILGASRRNAEGIEIPGGENLVSCDVIEKPQNEEEPDPKLFEQGELKESTRNTDLQQRVELCRQIMSKPYKMVNPTVENGEIVEGDPNTEQVAQALTRINLELIDELGKDANSVTKPADIELTKEQVASAVVIGNDDGKEETIYELPKDQIEAYNTMLDKAAEAQKEVSRLTIGHLPDNSSQIKNNKLDDSVSLVQLNSLTKQMEKDLKGQKVILPDAKNIQETPVDLIQLAIQ